MAETTSLDVGSLKVAELKSELAARGLPVKGLKKELSDRLQEAVDSEQSKTAQQGEATNGTATPQEQSLAEDDEKEAVKVDESVIEAQTQGSAELEGPKEDQSSSIPEEAPKEEPPAPSVAEASTADVLPPSESEEKPLQDEDTPMQADEPETDPVAEDRKRKRENVDGATVEAQVEQDQAAKQGSDPVEEDKPVQSSIDAGSMDAENGAEDAEEPKKKKVKVDEQQMEEQPEASRPPVKQNPATEEKQELPVERHTDQLAANGTNEQEGSKHRLSASRQDRSRSPVRRQHHSRSRSRSPPRRRRQSYSRSRSPPRRRRRSSSVEYRRDDRRRSRSRSPRRSRSRSRSPAFSKNNESSATASGPPVSSSVYVTNLVRPFMLPQLKELLSEHGELDYFWIDSIKSHCYVTYDSIESAQSAMKALNKVQWPLNTGRTLSLLYLPNDKVAGFVREEEQSKILRQGRLELTASPSSHGEWQYNLVPYSAIATTAAPPAAGLASSIPFAIRGAAATVQRSMQAPVSGPFAGSSSSRPLQNAPRDRDSGRGFGNRGREGAFGASSGQRRDNGYPARDSDRRDAPRNNFTRTEPRVSYRENERSR